MVIIVNSFSSNQVKKRLNAFATALLKDLSLADFLGIRDRIVFNKQLELLGSLLNWSAAYSRSASLISHLTSRLRFLYSVQALGSPVLLANFRQKSLTFISCLISSIMYEFGRPRSFIVLTGAYSSSTSLNKRLKA